MWHEKRGQQHRAYWRKQSGGKDYEVFPTESQARAFIALAKKFGRDRIVARHRARAASATTAIAVFAPGTPAGQAITAPALAAGLTAPVPGGISLAWLGEQYVTSGNHGNEHTRSDYRRDLTRYVNPFFGRACDGDVDVDVDVAMIMTRPLPTLDGRHWPWPTVAAWKTWLGEQPRHDRNGKPIAGTPPGGQDAAQLVLRHLGCWYVPLVTWPSPHIKARFAARPLTCRLLQRRHRDGRYKGLS